MIEWCNRKRMLLCILALVCLSVVIIILEAKHLQPLDDNASDIHEEHPILQAKLSPDDKCWKTEEYKVIDECDVCTDKEKMMGDPVVCTVGNAYKELVECKKKGRQTYRSCDRVKWIEVRKFWKFEALCSVVGFFSGLVVYVRQKQLDHRMYQRIQRQIANTGA